MDLGATMCCDSAHKTLPVLTGGAYLHISHTAPSLLVEQAEAAMAVFASTSPSYLILQSLDAANAYLAEEYRAHLAVCAERVYALKKALKRYGYMLCGNEPLKITVAPKVCGYIGTELAAYLQQNGFECEASDPDFTVMMITPQINGAELDRLEQVLCSLPLREAIVAWAPAAPHTAQRVSPKEALLSPSVELPVEQCLGRVLATATVSCPPAIPVVVCGEEINEAAIRCFHYYGITTCRVIEE
jgi:arginine/lysine/ornithine decarboxylase